MTKSNMYISLIRFRILSISCYSIHNIRVMMSVNIERISFVKERKVTQKNIFNFLIVQLLLKLFVYSKYRTLCTTKKTFFQFQFDLREKKKVRLYFFLFSVVLIRWYDSLCIIIIRIRRGTRTYKYIYNYVATYWMNVDYCLGVVFCFIHSDDCDVYVNVMCVCDSLVFFGYFVDDHMYWLLSIHYTFMKYIIHILLN